MSSLSLFLFFAFIKLPGLESRHCKILIEVCKQGSIQVWIDSAESYWTHSSLVAWTRSSLMGPSQVVEQLGQVVSDLVVTKLATNTTHTSMETPSLDSIPHICMCTRYKRWMDTPFFFLNDMDGYAIINKIGNYGPRISQIPHH